MTMTIEPSDSKVGGFWFAQALFKVATAFDSRQVDRLVLGIRVWRPPRQP